MQEPQLTREQKDTVAGIQLSYYFELAKYRRGDYGRPATESEFIGLTNTYNLMIHLITNPHLQGVDETQIEKQQ